MDNRFLIGDQRNDCVVLCNPDGACGLTEEWVYPLGIDHIAGIKYRQNTLFGDVILIASGANSGKAQMISYPEGKLLWSTVQAGNNPHCIEILPSGNIAVAASTGRTVRLFKTAALLSGQSERADCFDEVPLRAAHGVLWDPKYNVLWALGDFELNAYRIVGTGIEERLELCAEMSRSLPENKMSGHALAADLTDPDYLYLTVDSTVFRFDKKEGVFLSDFAGKDRVCHPWVKGLAKNRSGDFVLAVSNGVFRPWCTDTVLYLKKDGDSFLEQQIHLAETRAIYKVAPFCGSYL